jgi:general secretion pathway protein J
LKPLNRRWTETPTREFSKYQRGFTLLELLVVMTLLSLIMTGLVSAMRTMGQTERKIDARLEQLDNLRTARAFLQQTLARVSAMPLDANGATGKTVIPFIATADSLTWVGILPARANLGGRYFFRLAIESVDDKPALVIRFAPWRPDLIFTDWEQAESRILFHGIQQLKVQAQGLPKVAQDAAPTWPIGWQDGWPIVDAPPEQVRLTLADAQGAWPEWIFALKVLPQGDSTYSRVAVGGGAMR